VCFSSITLIGVFFFFLLLFVREGAVRREKMADVLPSSFSVTSASYCLFLLKISHDTCEICFPFVAVDVLVAKQ
jgi:hypothetical protein